MTEKFINYCPSTGGCCSIYKTQDAMPEDCLDGSISSCIYACGNGITQEQCDTDCVPIHCENCNSTVYNGYCHSTVEDYINWDGKCPYLP